MNQSLTIFIDTGRARNGQRTAIHTLHKGGNCRQEHLQHNPFR